jgi:signal transduction histidine kinase
LKKSIFIFLLAVLVPSLVLGWLALRSAGEQQIILERRTAELYQKETEAVAAAARTLVDDERRSFAEVLRRMLAGEEPGKLAAEFAPRLAAAWPRRAVGFALGDSGQLLSPTAQAGRRNADWQGFLTANSSFLANAAPAEVYAVQADELNRPEALRKRSFAEKASKDATKDLSFFDGAKGKGAEVAESFSSAKKEKALAESPPPAAAPAPAAEPAAVAKPSADASRTKSVGGALATDGRNAAVNAGALRMEAPARPADQGQALEKKAEEQAVELNGYAVGQDKVGEGQAAALRKVAPQRSPVENRQAVSQLVVETAEFRALTAGANEGVVTRFVADRLEILFWQRAGPAPGFIFGCMLQPESLREVWPAAFPATAAGSLASAAPEFVLALLDDKARPVATQPPGETGRDWKRPFVASEIGEALPHWEAALYLMRPQQIEESARSVRRTLILLIAAAIAAIAAGGWIVVADARREMALAQQKTDFVSNVSHELKTPLTSIRMFAELMQNGVAEAKRSQYLRIIMVEAERLTRLINNVLDFARAERRQERYEMRPLDLHALVARVWEAQELHLHESGFTTRWEAAPAPYPITGDEDALAQILVNLLSNAEKYAGERKDVELQTKLEGDRVCVSVLDRGLGVPAGQERRIFEAFHRAHDSLASGIQGSGLGLTLAQRMAHAHSGEITCAPREGGGSVFTLRLPLAEIHADEAGLR